MKTILISGIGGPTPRSIARTIKKYSPCYRIIGVDCNKKALGFYMDNLVDESLLVPRVSEDNYWEVIYNIIREKKVDMAFIQPESEVVAWGNYFIENGNYPCKVFLPYEPMASVLMDKSKMADILKGTHFIPNTIKITQDDPQDDLVEKEIGFPCWIRATQGSGGLGSLKLKDKSSLISWLFINSDLKEFTVSEFLEKRHLATQMMYIEGRLVKAALLECAEYVMASIAPSKVTGNTSFGRFLNENHALQFCDDCIKFIESKLNLPANGVLSFDLKEDSEGNLKVTEVNIRHMAYTGVMADVGFNLVADTISLLENGSFEYIGPVFYHYDKDYIFLRDVDIEPIVMTESDLKNH